MSNETNPSRKDTPAGASPASAPCPSCSRSSHRARRAPGRLVAPRRPALAAVLALALGGAACSGIDAGVEYPGDLPEPDRYLLTPENGADPSLTLGEFKIGPETCSGIDTHPVTQRLSPDDLTRFLEAQGAGNIAPKLARSNLYWFDFPARDGSFVRLRLAVLEDARRATQDLHDALLQHGPGWWGVRRSNLAVLAPKASLREAVAFAIKYKLVCWGMFTYAGNDDAYVVPGPYAEL
ncbi:hypothetical protein WMF31_13760 [Sorangium sp. So ce1036]|uniref:hypothetical protein n=1 Tax=Sorangium sp. So ce1036 TaxID=3133328 RepID=UPI003F093A4E